MPFPESARVIYEKNPLLEVICQLRFPTILQISSEEPAAFQSKIRAQYPLYEIDQSGMPVPKEISGLLAGLLAPKFAEQQTHKFLSEDSNRIISLNRDFVAIAERQYRRWEDFRKTIILARDALEEIYKPSFYSRIGLRYQDIIDKSALDLRDATWDSLVNPSFIGVLGANEIRDHVKEIRTNALIRADEVEGGLVRIRHGLRPQAGNGGETYLIDADFFTEDRRATQDVFGTLGTFNRLAGNLFRWAITPRLQHALGPVEIR